MRDEKQADQNTNTNANASTAITQADIDKLLQGGNEFYDDRAMVSAARQGDAANDYGSSKDAHRYAASYHYD